eukprot:5670758-Amphidinium_carterae.1
MTSAIGLSTWKAASYESKAAMGQFCLVGISEIFAPRSDFCANDMRCYLHASVKPELVRQLQLLCACCVRHYEGKWHLTTYGIWNATNCALPYGRVGME